MIRIFKILGLVVLCTALAINVWGKGSQYTAFTVKVTGKGQPLILIPGATCSGDEWNETVARYAGKFQCHVITLAGYAGTKPMEKGPYLATIKKELESYIINEQLEHVILMGHSIGGFLSLCISSETKAHLDKVIVVDALPFYAGTSNPNAPTSFSDEQAKELLGHYAKMNNEELKKSQLTTAKFLCRDSTYWDRIATWGAASDRKTLAYTITEMMTNDMRKDVSKIQIPTLVLGAYCKLPDYPAYTRETVVAIFEGQYKECSKCIVHVANDNAKHFIMYDVPEWFYSEVDNFIAK